MVTTLVILPTYNEAESLPVQLAALRRQCPEVDVLIIDDASPDGTGYVAQEAADADPQVFVKHRMSKEGLGAAYLDGFGWAFEHGYEIIVEMDADGSHQVGHLPAILAATTSADLVIGSRWVQGGSVTNWPRRRQVLSRGANAFVRIALGIPVKDSTAGYRAYRAEMLRSIDLSRVQSQGYCFQIDMCWRVITNAGSVTEVPIEFVERELGASKMTGVIIVEALLKVTGWAVVHRWRQLTGAYRREMKRSARQHAT